MEPPSIKKACQESFLQSLREPETTFVTGSTLFIAKEQIVMYTIIGGVILWAQNQVLT